MIRKLWHWLWYGSSGMTIAQQIKQLKEFATILEAAVVQLKAFGDLIDSVSAKLAALQKQLSENDITGITAKIDQ